VPDADLIFVGEVHGYYEDIRVTEENKKGAQLRSAFFISKL